MERLSKTCKVHGVLEEHEIVKRKVHVSKNSKGYCLRCRKCIEEGRWKARNFCKKHGILNEADIRKSDDTCAKCHRASVIRSVDRDREAFNEARVAKALADRMENPEKWANVYKRQYARSKEKHGLVDKTTKTILRMHGLTRDQYDLMFEEQGHTCKICHQIETRGGRTPGTVTRLVVDHCHKTNIVRGLLCHRCNVVIGLANDSIELLDAAIIYLEASSPI